MITSDEFSSTHVLRVDGSFDASAAWELHDMLRMAAPGVPVTIDFRQVRRFDDVAVGILADDVTSAPRLVSLLGLGQHQLRMLRFLGVADPAHGSDRSASSSH